MKDRWDSSSQIVIVDQKARISFAIRWLENALWMYLKMVHTQRYAMFIVHRSYVIYGWEARFVAPNRSPVNGEDV